jgi:AcrR family transcriptional regulator
MTRPYRAKTRQTATRGKILSAVRELLEEGSFHASTVEDVADRAGISRATLYQHFGSRLGLVDAMCESFDANPALVSLREADSLDELIALVVRFWASEEQILRQLYGVAAVDPAAADLVERQRADRRGELERLLRRLRPKDSRRALAHLLVLTSFETFEELRRHAGLSEPEVVRMLQGTARTLLGS